MICVTWKNGGMEKISTVAVLGGAGQVARRLHPLLVERGYRVVPLVRREEQAEELRSEGVTPRLLDIERAGVNDYAEALAGVDAVVFAAGGGPDGNAERKRTVDLGGTLAALAACSQLGVRRYVQVSAIGVDTPPDPDSPEAWRAYVTAKRVSDIAVRESELDWTILRPATLSNDPGTGHVQLGVDLPAEDVSRDDVAAVVAAVLDQPATVHRQWDLVGGVLPVAEAISRAAS